MTAYLTEFVDVALSAVAVKTHLDFDKWCREKLRKLIPFEMLICVTGQLHGDIIVVQTMHPVDYPEEYLNQIHRQVRLTERKVIQRWLTTRCPQIVKEDEKHAALSDLERAEFERFQLRNIAAHGIIDPDGRHASYFSFSRLPEALVDDLPVRLELAVPYLHRALLQAQASQLIPDTRISKLTARDFQILRGLMLGKTNSDIAAELYRSPNTVKHQVASLFKKLGAQNRSQAVALATAMGVGVMPTAIEKGPVRAIE